MKTSIETWPKTFTNISRKYMHYFLLEAAHRQTDRQNDRQIYLIAQLPSW